MSEDAKPQREDDGAAVPVDPQALPAFIEQVIRPRAAQAGVSDDGTLFLHLIGDGIVRVEFPDADGAADVGREMIKFRKTARARQSAKGRDNGGSGLIIAGPEDLPPDPPTTPGGSR